MNEKATTNSKESLQADWTSLCISWYTSFCCFVLLVLLKQKDIITNIRQGLHVLLCLKFIFVINVFVAHAQMQVHKTPCDPAPKVYCHLHAKSCPS